MRKTSLCIGLQACDVFALATKVNETAILSTIIASKTMNS